MKMRDKFGVCQWFHFEDHERVYLAENYLYELGVQHLRINVSWADYCKPRGPQWYSWLFETFSDYEILPCIVHTPPLVSGTGRSNGEKRHAKNFSEFLSEFLKIFGHRFDAIELWNEPGSWLKGADSSEPHWRALADMITHGVEIALQHRKKVVFGGMSPVTGEWIQRLQLSNHALKEVGVIGIRAFPGEWKEPDGKWQGWHTAFNDLERYSDDRDIWVTETGCSARDPIGQQQQTRRLIEALVQGTQHAKRVYWYSLLDLPDGSNQFEFPIGEQSEQPARSFGLVSAEGQRKSAYYSLRGLLASKTAVRTH